MTALEATEGSVDGLIDELGFGKYQLLTAIFILITMYINGVATSVFIFTARDTQYRCRVLGCDPADSDAPYHVKWLPDAIPIEADQLSKCTRNGFNEEFNEILNYTNVICDKDVFNSSHQETCTEWVYGEGYSIVREFKLNCILWMTALVGTLNGAGQFLNLIYLGSLSDKYGRRNTMLFTSILSGIIGFVQSFVPEYWSFIVLDFLNTALSSGNFSVAFVMGVELFPTRRNVVGTCALNVFSNLLSVMIGAVAWQVPYWRQLLRVLYSPTILLVILAWIMPESIRWLVAKGHNKQSVEAIEKAARWNDVKLSEKSLKFIDRLKSGESEEEIKNIAENQSSVPLASVLHSRRLLIRLIICAFVWIVEFFVYFGLTMNSVSISGDNVYLSYMLSVAADLPSLILYYYLPTIVGRRASLCTGLVICSVFCFIFPFIRWEHETGALIVFLIAKTFLSFSFSLIHFYTSEMFPTTLRHSCLGCCSMLGRLGIMLASQVVLLDRWHASLPMVMYGAAALAAGCTALAFPETRNTVLPENIAEAESIGMKMKGNQVNKSF